MVFLNLDDAQKEKLSLLNDYDASIVAEFCRIAAEFIDKEINNKMINSAAQKLNAPAKLIRELIELIVWILIENSKLSLTEKELKESLTLAANLKPELIDEIIIQAKNSENQLHSYIGRLKLNTIQYNNLEWRVDIKLATRSLRKCIEPEIILKLDLKDEHGQIKPTVLQTDIANLNHLVSSLDDALNEIRSNYSRRVFRSIK